MDFPDYLVAELPRAAGPGGHGDRRLEPSGPRAESTQARTVSAAGNAAPQMRSRRIRQSDVLMLTSQLAIMCQSGLDLAEALRSVADDCRHLQLKRVLDAVYADVSNGAPLSSALARHEEVFGKAYVASIAAAESSGTMTDVLSRLADLLRSEIRLRSSITSILAYPVALVGVTGLVLVALVFFVLPQFGTVFTNMNKPAPPITQMLLSGASFLRAHVAVLAGTAVMAGIAGVRIARTELARRYWDGFILNFALFREAARALIAGRSFRLLGTMLQSGVPLLESVRLCRSSVRNVHLQSLFDAMEHDVVGGLGIGERVRAAEILPPGVAQMVSTAERTGRLGMVLEMVGSYYEEDGERRLRQVVKILEPVVIVVMGVVVAGVVLSVMLPLLDVSTMSR